MPFTFSHPAAVLPLAYLPKKYVCMTGLVAGSLAPDFEYFLGITMRSEHSHSVGGIFWFCLPVGLLLCFIFHDIIRNSFIDNLPLFLKKRYYNAKKFNWNRYFVKHWFVAILSVLAGAGSHLLWDYFTHGQYSAYQLPSTVVGGLIVCFAVFITPKSEWVAGRVDWRYWLVFLVLAAAIAYIRFPSGWQGFEVGQIRFLSEWRGRAHDIGAVVVCALSACFVSITATSLIWSFRRRRKRAE
ncbi:MAG: DUF4184 family protein [Chitinispirillales bacterium]|jgi:hypothetical protein|nr:DUF4184 family protein [Chitinispirillales bacterium]